MSYHNLYVVGTYHLDVDGEQRLNSLLDKLAPQIIALEMSKDRDYVPKKPTEKENQKQIEDLIKESGVKFNAVQKKTFLKVSKREVLGYELKVSKEYTTKNLTSKLEYIDTSIFSDRNEFENVQNQALKDLFKLMVETPELAQPFLEALNGGVKAHLKYLRYGAQQAYQNKEMIREMYETFQDPKIIEMLKKEMSPEQIKFFEGAFNPARDKAMAKRIRELYDQKKILVAIVGVAHLSALESKLKKLKPKIMTLDEYDLI